jgi:polyisoprenoid-binding protein YceI
MKQFFVALFLQFSLSVAFTTSSVAQQYTAVDQGSSVKFKIKNFGFNSEGTFTGLQGHIGFDPQNLSGATFEVSIDAASVNTDNNMRDNHLRKEEYFDVQNHPRISFVSSAVRAAGNAGSYTMTGRLTIKETSKEISFPFTASPQETGCLFKGEFTINRKDFKVGGSSTLSNSLTVQLSVFAKKE